MAEIDEGQTELGDEHADSYPGADVPERALRESLGALGQAGYLRAAIMGGPAQWPGRASLRDQMNAQACPQCLAAIKDRISAAKNALAAAAIIYPDPKEAE